MPFHCSSSRSSARPPETETSAGSARSIELLACRPTGWLVDPSTLELTVLALVDAAYTQTQQLSGRGELRIDASFPVALRPFA
jgi:hypothetical protein